MASGTKEKILQKALDLFNEVGYVEVGVREIARALEISPGNLSYHFSKKEDILFSILFEFSEQNNKLYDEYFAAPPTSARFLTMMKKVFENQYNFRGVYIGNQFIQAALLNREGFDYNAIAARRVATFKRIFDDLNLTGQIRATEEDVSFLISFITLFGRFWISEATMFHKSPDKVQTIGYYLSLLARQISLFATEKGRKSIDEFRTELA